MDKQDIKDAADELYGAGYNAAKLERDYDPRGCTEWQDVVDLVPGEQKTECPNCEGAGHLYEGGMSMNPEVDNKVPCPDCSNSDDEGDSSTPVGWEGYYTRMGGTHWFWCRIVGYDEGCVILKTKSENLHRHKPCNLEFATEIPKG